MSAHTAELPIHTLPDGRQFIADRDLQEPHAAAFVQRLSNYWTRDGSRCGYVGPPIASTIRGTES